MLLVEMLYDIVADIGSPLWALMKDTKHASQTHQLNGAILSVFYILTLFYTHETRLICRCIGTWTYPFADY
jgi:hypothetical protein